MKLKLIQMITYAHYICVNEGANSLSCGYVKEMFTSGRKQENQYIFWGLEYADSKPNMNHVNKT